jgi:large repetitive protein
MHINILKWHVIMLLLISNSSLLAQQNCFDATAICQNSYSQTNANSGTGSTNELSASNQGCLTNGEVNSSWYILNTTTAGNLVFTITPNSSTDDYDFAIWDITDTNCGAIANGASPLRCNFASLVNSSPGGLTGLNVTAALPSYGAAGPSFSSAIATLAGQTFVILVNNNSNSTNGYNLNFTGSTCNIIDNTAPQVKKVIVPPSCTGPSSIKILFKENIKCATIAGNGSDFSVNNGVTISSALGSSCSGGALFSSAINLNFAVPLAPGSYTCTINSGLDGNTLHDNCGNAISAGTTFTFVVLPKVSIAVTTQFGCSGSSSGSISAAGGGGYSPYTYKLNSGTFNTGNTFNALSAGSYTLTIKDSFGCIDDTVIALSAAPPINITGLSSINLTCFGANNGSITVTANGGNAPLSYAVNSQPYSSNNTISNLGPGSFVVHVKDANGCIKDTVVLLTSPGSILYTSLSITNATCAGSANGSIVVTATGGTSPLQYALNNGAYSAFGTYSSLPAATYTLHIKDANNCIKDTVITITQPLSSLSTTIANIVQPNCSGGTGSFTAAASGGSSPYSYSINGNTYSGSSIFASLSSGTYTVYVKDAGNCVATTAVVLSTPGNIFISASAVVVPTCIAQGSISITAGGGVPPITYAINIGPYSAANTFTNLVAGSYTLHAKDNNGCIHDTIITLPVASLPQIAITAQTNVTCSSPTTGLLTVAANGGIAPYLYAFNGGVFGGTNSFTGLVAGVYTITVQGTNGCTASTTATISSSNTLSFASFNKTDVGCGGSPLGSILAIGTSGNGPYQYNINGGVFSGSGTFSNLPAGTYTVIVKDASGCTKSSTTTINASATLSLSSTFTNALCSNPGNGSMNITAAGGFGLINYYINGGYLGTSGSTTGWGPGTYTISAIDGLGCSVTTVITLTGPPKLWFTNTTVVLPPCYGGVGSINTSGIGGLAPYTFANGNGTYGGSGTFNNLPAGTYTIHLKDANGCIHDTIINLIQPNPVANATPTVINAACNGAATGSISLNGTGGTPSYTYNLNGSAWGSTNVFSNLAAGVYTVGIKDANGCTGQVVLSINSNGNFYFGSSTSTPPICYNGNAGSLSFTGSGGTAPYQYALNTGAYVGTNLFTGLTSGTYTAYVKDAGNCVATSLITVPNATPTTFASTTSTPPTCFNGGNGSLACSASGGTAPFTYSINGGAYTSSGLFSALASGSYTLTAKDANNCTTNTTIAVNNALPVLLAISVVPPGCFGTGNGSITLSGAGGTGPYTYSLNAGAFTSTSTFNALLAGTYTVSTKDANNCTTSAATTLVTATGVSVSQVVIISPSCAQINNGSVTVTGSSQNLPLTFSVNGGTSQAVGLFSGLGTGSYTFTLTDALGCFRDTIINLSSSSNLAFTNISYTNVLCFGATTGTIAGSAVGGNGITSYAINSGNYVTNNTFTNLTNGTYTLHAKDNVGCIVDTVITISAPPLLQFNMVNITAPYCNGSQDGSISVSASGGVGPLSYSINNSSYSSGTNFSNLIQSMYTFYVQDANGCVYDTVINLVGPDVVYYSLFTLNSISCFGASDGALTCMASGGIAPYQYSLNSGAFTVVNQFTSLPAGNYTLIAKDNQGCINDTTVSIAAPASSVQLNILNISNNICRGDSAGALTVQGIGGTAPFAYSFGSNTNFTASNSKTNLPAGSVTVYVKDLNGCPYDTIVTIGEPDSSAQILLVGTQKNSCIGVYDAQIRVSAKNGFPPYAYSINSISQGLDSVFENLIPGDYVVEVTDSIGCVSTGKYAVDSTNRSPSLIITSVVDNICIYDQIASAAWIYNDAYYPVTITIDTTNISDSNIAQLASGTYVLHMTDAKGCVYDTSFSITYQDSLNAEAIATAARCDGDGSDGAAKAMVSGGPSPYLFEWGTIATTNYDTISDIDYGTYTLTVTDNKGCKDTAAFKILYEPCCSAFVPNAFTPNNDMVNDFVPLRPFGPIKFLGFEIYNRYGQKIFMALSFDDKWDGRYNGELCELGTYYYMLKYSCPLSQGVQLQKGDITLIK